ncbi:MAG: D-alanyl-D-alanine carboxypeptidase/D-alanyl-D-alanine-endopeptidase [Bacteroidota bacterium]
MKKFISGIVCCLIFTGSFGQTINQKLQKAFTQFESDSQLKNAISSLYVIEAKTGKVVFDKNSRVGLAPASTQKIVTATTAFELLGKDYKYTTEFSYDGEVKDSLLIGEIYINGHGDPTLGSWRYIQTKPETIKTKFIDALHKKKISSQRGSFIGLMDKFEYYSIPDGWVWQDIGNYYGAAAGGLNWNENQYDLVLKPGKNEGDSVKVIRTEPIMLNQFINELKTGTKNSGDNGYIYFEPGSDLNYVKGSIPCCVDSFTISGSVSNSNYFTLGIFADILNENKFKAERYSDHFYVANKYFNNKKPVTIFYTHYSPSLDSIIYWFLKKSINLYGEALVKTIGYKKKGYGATDTGVQMVKDFWKQRGIDPRELNLYDGSGLSPLNRITTHAQVEILKYAKRQTWFSYFYDALPDYNGMKLKSGTISDVKGFCGYNTSKGGNEYIISFLVNNYNGSSSTLVNKMYHVLDILK